MPSLEELNETQKWDRWKLLQEEFFAALMRAATKAPKGVFIVALDDEGNYLGYICGFEQVMSLATPVMHMYAIFSNQKQQGVGKFLSHRFDEVAKERGYKVTTLCSARFGGSAFRFFEDRLGYRRVNTTFAKEL